MLKIFLQRFRFLISLVRCISISVSKQLFFKIRYLTFEIFPKSPSWKGFISSDRKCMTIFTKLKFFNFLILIDEFIANIVNFTFFDLLCISLIAKLTKELDNVLHDSMFSVSSLWAFWINLFNCLSWILLHRVQSRTLRFFIIFKNFPVTFGISAIERCVNFGRKAMLPIPILVTSLQAVKKIF